MPSAEEILKARDEGASVDEKPVVDFPEETAALEPVEPAPAGRGPSPERPGGDARPQVEDDDDGDEGERGPVPYQALKAERQKAKRYTEEVADLRRQLSDLTNAVLQQRQQPQQPQQPEQPPEFDWDNPHATIDQRVEARVQRERAAIAAEFQKQREATQSQFAMTRHGEDVVKAAYKALAEARESDPNWPQDYQKIMRSGDQYEAMVQWHKQRKVLQEIGPDPEAYKAKIRAEYLEELRTGRVMDEPRAETPRERSGTVMPSNLSGARSVGSRTGPTWSGPSSIKDIFASRNG